jgi:flagellar hook assembly protein FlgD
MMRQFEVVAPVAADGTPAARLALVPARPNPFTVTTTIVYELPKAADVRLVVFDVAGRARRTLVTGRVDSGGHSVAWDGRDDAGRALAPGLYFIRLETDGAAVVGKALRVAR